MPNVSDAIAEKMAQESAQRAAREREEKLKKAQRHRLDYMLKLNDLGLHEHVVLQYGPKGIVPVPQIVDIDGKERAEARKMIETAIAQLTGIHVSNTGIVGVDGLPA